MKTILSGKLKNTIYNLTRELGYHFQGADQKTGELGFARPKSGYPRWHLFAKIEQNSISISLHLDQKKPIYDSAAAHNGDYDGPVVVQEFKRIKEYLENQINR